MIIKYFFLASLLLIHIQVLARTLIISDIDDTIKQSNVLSVGGAISSISLKTKDFDRLKKIFLELKKQGDIDFYYISSSPNCLVSQALWLETKGFPKGKISQRNCGRIKNDILKDTYSFKIKQIDDYLYHHLEKYDQIVFFGDNAEKDEDIYLAVQTKYNTIQSLIFIRDVRLQATKLDSKLKLIKKNNIHYFLSEKELIANSYFEMISSDLQLLILSDFKRQLLFPTYYQDNLARRYEKELNIDDDFSKIKAREKLENYVMQN